MELKQLQQQLKQLIIDECDKTEFSVDDIDSDELLFGSESRIDLDSLDALQISVAIKNCFKVRIDNSHQTRKVFKNINTLSEYIYQHAPNG